MLRRVLESRWFLAAAAVVLLGIAVASLVEIRVPERPAGGPEAFAELAERDDLNVLFIVIDTLRADRLGAYGYGRETSPIMDQLASSGVRFERVVAQSTWTKTSMASLWTGTWPARNRVLRWSHALPEEVEMPAEVFRARGYRTLGIYRNGWVAPNFGFRQGFESYVRPRPGPSPDRFRKRTPSSSPLTGSDEDVTHAAQEFLRGVGDEKFLLYLHYMDVHQYAYDAISGRFGNSYSDAYDNAIHWVDRNVADVVKTLDAQDLLAETLIVIASDHGEAFYEHGFEGHARNLYREVTEVPLILVPPFRPEEPIVVEQTVRNVDIWPTLYDLLGFDDVQGPVDGRSLVPLIEAAARGTEAPEDAAPRAAFAHLDIAWGSRTAPARPTVSVTRGTDRLIVTAPEVPEPVDGEGAAEGLDGADGEDPFGYGRLRGSRARYELFDHARDPKETRNRADTHPEDVERLRSALDPYLAMPPAAWGEPTERHLDEMELNQLRALGYVVD